MKCAPLFKSIDQVKNFLKTNKASNFSIEIVANKDKYEFIKTTFWKLGYNCLSKKEKHFTLLYLKFFTNYSVSHLKRLSHKWRTGVLYYNPIKQKNKFSQKYFPVDIALLIKTDVLHDCVSGEATRKILWREYNKFGKVEYATISQISSSHIYNIRNKNRQYNSSEAKYFKRTKATQVNIGIRRKPEQNNKPGYLRVDTAHQGDFMGKKGVYHINIVDKKGKIKKDYNQWLTPYEKLRSLENAEQYLKPEFNFFELDKIAYEKSDNDFAEEMNKAKTKLFKLIFRK